MTSWDDHVAHVEAAHSGVWKFRCGLCGFCVFDDKSGSRVHRMFCKLVPGTKQLAERSNGAKTVFCTICEQVRSPYINLYKSSSTRILDPCSYRRLYFWLFGRQCREMEFPKNWVLLKLLSFELKFPWVFKRNILSFWKKLSFCWVWHSKIQKDWEVRAVHSTLCNIIWQWQLTSLLLHWLYWKKAHHDKNFRNIEF